MGILGESRLTGATWTTILGSLGLKTVKIKAIVTIETMMKTNADTPKQILSLDLAMVLGFGYEEGWKKMKIWEKSTKKSVLSM